MRVLSTNRMKFMRVRDLKLAQPPKKTDFAYFIQGRGFFFSNPIYTTTKQFS